LFQKGKPENGDGFLFQSMSCLVSIHKMRKPHQIKEFKSINSFFFLSVSYEKFLDNLAVIKLSGFATFNCLVIGVAKFKDIFSSGVASFSSLLSSWFSKF
jgi:hypothetical protein